MLLATADNDDRVSSADPGGDPHLHRFRARRSGPRTFVGMHVSFDREMSFVEAHRLSETVSAVVEAAHQAGLARKVARLEPVICIKG